MVPGELTQLTAGLTVDRVTTSPTGALVVHFTNGTALRVEARGADVGATVRRPAKRESAQDGRKEAPTARQRDYLVFIARYRARCGVSPAEGDIQRHFLVSAPSVNAMIRTLEARGFIARGRNLWGQAAPRSIRVLVDLS
jgi:hypothetical protein